MELLAKSKAKEKSATPPTILEHCRTVRVVAKTVWESIESDLADALGRTSEDLGDSILPLYRAAALLHDIAKANSAFQALVHPGDGHKKRQPVRHEVLAGVLLTDERFLGNWLAQALSDRQRWAVVWAVAGHHLEMRRKRFGETEDPLYKTGNTPCAVTLYLDHTQVQQLLEEMRKALAAQGADLGDIPAQNRQSFDTLDDTETGLEAAVRKFVRRSDSAWRQLQRDAAFRQDLALLKALLIAADVGGSALAQSGKTITSCVPKWLSARLDAQKADKIAEDKLDGRPRRDFQTRVAESQNRVTVVTAGCGNGKTTAAYLWAKEWGNRRKLFFAYPTTGTASAGFQDYLFAQTELERALIHSRAEVDLHAMLESPQEEESATARAQRQESLLAWGQQVIACTVDTVLGLIQNQRRPLFGFPAIACGAFVFDEVHSYDRRLFAELLRFLETFPGVPVLIMSASIPPNRLDALRRVAGKRMNEQPIPGDKKLEKVLRYRIQRREVEQCWAALQDLLCGSMSGTAPKALWVCNTVKASIDVFREARQRLAGVETLLYHSRYRYADRVERQKAVIDEFRYLDKDKTERKHERPGLAVATQVCEMSLDISADLLVSALCPLPSLVQRLGRLNRYATKDDTKPALIYEFEGRPYHKDDHPAQMEAANAMIEKLGAHECSQRDLAKFINQMQSSEDWSEPLYSAWLDGGWQSEPLPARDGDNSITLVRQEDVTGIQRPWTAKKVIPWTIPMLSKRGFSWEYRAGGYPVAPAGMIDYDEREGASWADSKKD